MAVLMIRRIADIAKHNAVIPRIRTSMAGLALRRKDRFRRSAALDAWRRLWERRYECDRLVHIASGLGPRG